MDSIAIILYRQSPITDVKAYWIENRSTLRCQVSPVNAKTDVCLSIILSRCCQLDWAVHITCLGDILMKSGRVDIIKLIFTPRDYDVATSVYQHKNVDRSGPHLVNLLVEYLDLHLVYLSHSLNSCSRNNFKSIWR